MWKHQNKPACTNTTVSESGGLWKHQNKPACTKSIRVFKVPMYRRTRRREQVAADAGAKKVTILSDTKLKGKKQPPLTLSCLADQAKGMR